MIDVRVAPQIDDLMNACKSMGFSRLLLSIEPPPVINGVEPMLPIRLVFHGWNDRTIEQYAQVAADDPLRRPSIRNRLPLSNLPHVWRVQQGELIFGDTVRCSSRESAVVQSAVPAGILTGFSTPIYSQHSTLAVVNLYSDSDISDAEMALRGERLFFLSHQLYARLRSLCIPCEAMPPGVRLSRREQECVKWAAQGKNSGEIALLLGLRVQTVRDYFKSASRRLQVTTRAQAVARAIELGLLQ